MSNNIGHAVEPKGLTYKQAEMSKAHIDALQAFHFALARREVADAEYAAANAALDQAQRTLDKAESDFLSAITTK